MADPILEAFAALTRRLDQSQALAAQTAHPGLAKMESRVEAAMASARDDRAALQAQILEGRRLAGGQGPAAFAGAARLGAVSGLEGQERSLAGVMASADPAILRENVRLEQEITKATKEREIEKRRLEMAPQYLADSLRLEQEITKAAKERQIAQTQYQARPEVAAEQAALDARLAAAQRAKGLAGAKAAGAEDPARTLGGAGMDIASRLPGGGLLGAASNVVGAATGEKAAGLSGAFEGMGMISAAAGPMGMIAAAAPAAIDGIKGLASVIIDLGGKASPGELQRFVMATEDLQAVPALELFTHATQVLGDFMSTALPSRDEVEEILGPLHDAIEELKPTLAEVAPIIKDLVEYQLKHLVFGIKVFAEGIKLAIEIFKNTPLGWIMRGLGYFKEGGGLQDRDRAPRDAQMMNVDAYLKAQYQSAYKTGGRDPARQTADNTRESAEHLRRIAAQTDPANRPARAGRGDVDDATRRGVERGSH